MEHPVVEKHGVVYVAIHRDTGRYYVGLTTKPLKVRIKEHIDRARLGYRSHFYSAIRKHGFESFVFFTAEKASGRKALEEAECKWISRLQSKAPLGYNQTNGGQGTSGLTEKTEAWKAAVTSPSHRAKLSETTKAWRAAQTPEQKAAHNKNVGLANRGRKLPQMCGENNPSCTPEARRKISEFRKLEWASGKRQRMKAERVGQKYFDLQETQE